MKTVLIPKGLYKALEQEITTHNKETSHLLKLDVTVYFISLIISLPSYNRTDEFGNNYARLSSIKLRQLHHKYQDYLKFLIRYGFIVKQKNYGVDIKTCNAYSIAECYMADEVRSYEITDKFLLNRFNAYGQDKSQENKMSFAGKHRPHLVECFNEKLSMDSEGAYREIGDFLDSNHEKYLSGSQLILEWHKKAWNYSIKPETDNRLHTTLTRTNRELRKYIRYNGEKLGALDIKTSQPYFLCCILKGICNKDKLYLKRIGATQIIENDLLYELFDVNTDVDNARYFANLVLNGDLYKSLIKKIPMKYENGLPFRMVWPNGRWGEPKVKKYYACERDLVKEVVLEFFNGSSKSKKPEIVAIRKEFPAISELIAFLSNAGVEFYRLLCHVEAYCLLDCAAAKIAVEYPSMPLFSIHDALVTTMPNLEDLEAEVEYLLQGLTGLRPYLKLECWGENKKEILIKESTDLP